MGWLRNHRAPGSSPCCPCLGDLKRKISARRQRKLANLAMPARLLSPSPESAINCHRLPLPTPILGVDGIYLKRWLCPIRQVKSDRCHRVVLLIHCGAVLLAWTLLLPVARFLLQLGGVGGNRRPNLPLVGFARRDTPTHRSDSLVVWSWLDCSYACSGSYADYDKVGEAVLLLSMTSWSLGVGASFPPVGPSLYETKTP